MTKIIVTTRLQKVSSTVDPTKAFHLDKLPHDDCLSIFTQRALRARNFDGHLQFKQVGEDIVRKCNGLPLAAKVIGSFLRTTKNLDEWEKIYESEIWDLPEIQCGIIPALRLSYHHLPSHLKRCFAYCSIFPKDYEFEEEEMILLWNAEGFFQQKAKHQIKDLGNQCFQDLVLRSFFQISSEDKSRFLMYDLINDLAKLVAGDLYCRLEENKQQMFSHRSRHSSFMASMYDTEKKFKAYYQLNSLRTFLALKKHNWGSYLSNVVLVELLPRLSYLRVLSLCGYEITELPEFLENLKHLRYLNLSRTRIKCLPNSLCTLYPLETLLLKECSKLQKLPSKMENLVNLQYLDIRGADSIETMPLGIGNLTNLQMLSDFVIGESDGHRIGELKDLPKLRNDFRLSRNLSSLKLLGCKNCKSLPAIGRLPSLKGLSICGLDEVHKIGDEFFGEDQSNTFASLETLSFESLPNWEEWDICEGDEQVSKFPCLRELSIKECPQLSGRLPTRLPSLQRLEIYLCMRLVVSISSFQSLCELSVKWCEELVDECSSSPVKEVTSLQSVSLLYISKFSIPAETIRLRFAKSTDFGINDFNMLSEVSHAFTLLTKMELQSCEGLVSFAESNFPPALKQLKIWTCDNLLYLFDETSPNSPLPKPEQLISQCQVTRNA
ncbi:hypothetical protein GQ457_01G002250 [Hibiscus cannabinus]